VNEEFQLVYKIMLLQSHGRAKILVMEYCAGGSVYKMLEDPINLYGLLEDEFLIFLHDISMSSLLMALFVVVHDVISYCMQETKLFC